MLIKNKRLKSLVLLFLLLFFCLQLGMQVHEATAGSVSIRSNVYTVSELTQKAVEFISEKYKAGEQIDAYIAYVLSSADEDLTSPGWTNGKTSLKDEIRNLAGLLGNCNSLITYITATQNNDGSFGPYANGYCSKAALQSLAGVQNKLSPGSDIYERVQAVISKAVDYFKTGYRNGSTPYDVNGLDFDYRCVEALAESGEDLSSGEWVYNGASLKDTVKASADSTANVVQDNPAVRDAVYLAKELKALYAVDPASNNVDVLAGAVIAKQNTSIAGQVYFGGSIYDDAVVLDALGKTGKIGFINQEGALAYINTFKHPHLNSWGSPAGAAWGFYYTEESDLTAQVLTALSFFAEADEQGSDVYNTIQEGLDYLADIQDADTAAIKNQWDSTFSTAETLIALKALDKTNDDYVGASSNWVKSSKTKTISQCLLAMNQWNDTSHRDQLSSLLANRQKTVDPGKGSFENSVYSDMWAYLALGEAGKIGSLNSAKAGAYILSKQVSDGSWGESFAGVYYSDILSTTQALRALSYLPDAGQIQKAIDNGLAYLKSIQKEDGGVYSSWDDPAVDNSELIITLHRLGNEPDAAEWQNSEGLTPVDYLLNNTMNADGSFGSAKNVFSATEALAAFLAVSGEADGIIPGENGQPVEEKEQYSVYIAVVGQNGELLYNPDSVTVSKNGKWGLTALGALHATGLVYTYTNNGSFVQSIAGQANTGMKGWMYSVNGASPAVPACDRLVSEGDRVIWWYSNDIVSASPPWDSLMGVTGTGIVDQKTAEQSKKLPVALQASDKALMELDRINQSPGLKNQSVELNTLNDAASAVVVVGNRQPLDFDTMVALKNELARNVVDLNQKVEVGKEACVIDKEAEVALNIPAEALEHDLVITVQKVVAGNSQSSSRTQYTIPEGFRQVSAVYDFGPDGATFVLPAVLTLKVLITPMIGPENMALAWYNKSTGKWIIIPAVVDLDKGLILAKLKHFSSYAVFVREPVKHFSDVTFTSFGWAGNTIEKLAGAGIIDGVDGKSFEPARAATRAEFTCMLVKALGLWAKEDDTHTFFEDIRSGDWYNGAVTAAFAAGLINGYEDRTFRPNNIITREEAAVMLARVMKLKPEQARVTFSDSDRISSWAASSIASAAAHGLITGFPDGAFRPDAGAVRAECAVMIYRMLVSFY